MSPNDVVLCFIISCLSNKQIKSLFDIYSGLIQLNGGEWKYEELIGMMHFYFELNESLGPSFISSGRIETIRLLRIT